MKILSFLLVCILVLTSCVTAKETYGPSGGTAYSISCPGLARSWGDCFEKAGKQCGTSGYTIVSATNDRGAIANVSSSGAFASSTFSRNMLVECKR